MPFSPKNDEGKLYKDDNTRLNKCYSPRIFTKIETLITFHIILGDNIKSHCYQHNSPQIPGLTNARQCLRLLTANINWPTSSLCQSSIPDLAQRALVSLCLSEISAARPPDLPVTSKIARGHPRGKSHLPRGHGHNPIL